MLNEKSIDSTKSEINNKFEDVENKIIKEKSKKISELAEEDIKGRNERRKDDSNNANDKKFFWLVQDFLARRQEPPALKDKLFQNGITTIGDIKEEKGDIIKKAIKESGYKFSKKGLPDAFNLIIAAKKVLNECYNGNCETYFREAEEEENYKNNFIQDPFLDVKFVKYKLRNYALSDFSDYYIAIDTNVVKALEDLELFEYREDFGIIIPERYFLNKQINKGYDIFQKDFQINVFKFCLKLSDTLSEVRNEKFIPLKVDRTLWHYGKSIDNKNKKTC